MQNVCKSPNTIENERFDRTLADKFRALFFETKVPTMLCGEDAYVDTYLLNKSATKSLPKNVTPAEL